MADECLQRSIDVKEVIHIKACRFSGHFNADSKKFAVDPRVTSFSDIKEILVNAFNLDGSFHLSYLCRDDKGEDVYLALHTEWDLDVAFTTSSDPCLILKVELLNYCGSCHRKSKNKLKQTDTLLNRGITLGSNSSDFPVSPSWSGLAGNAITRITNRIGQRVFSNGEEIVKSFFPRKPPLGDCELHDYLDKRGRLVKPEDLRLRVYYGGIQPSLRKVAWRLLLNVFPNRLTAQERVMYMKRKTREYHHLYTQCKSLHSNSVEELERMIWEDVIRTDRTHPYYSGSNENPHLISLHNLLLTYALTHKNVRYCQGMSDIAAPILVVMNNESQAYACFCGLMTRLESNFYPDGKAMSTKFEHLALLLQCYDSDYFGFLKRVGADNMYFCYRWVLLEMKREFSFDDALVVLEVIWSSLPPLPPENDLPLGVLCAYDAQSNLSKTSGNGSKRMTLPSLTLNVKNFPVTLRVEKQSGDLTGERSSKWLDNSCGSTDDSFLVVPQHWTAFEKNREPVMRTADQNISVGWTDSAYTNEDTQSQSRLLCLPPPEKFGRGNPFLLFVCLSVLLEQRSALMSKTEYADLAMHFDRKMRGHCPTKILSQAMQLFASYLESHSKTVS